MASRRKSQRHRFQQLPSGRVDVLADQPPRPGDAAVLAEVLPPAQAGAALSWVPVKPPSDHLDSWQEIGVVGRGRRSELEIFIGLAGQAIAANAFHLRRDHAQLSAISAGVHRQAPAGLPTGNGAGERSTGPALAVVASRTSQ